MLKKFDFYAVVINQICNFDFNYRQNVNSFMQILLCLDFEYKQAHTLVSINFDLIYSLIVINKKKAIVKQFTKQIDYNCKFYSRIISI